MSGSTQDATMEEAVAATTNGNADTASSPKQQQQQQQKEVVPDCHLWTQNRCPYGNHCKFSHNGPGGATMTTDATTNITTIPKSEKDCTAWKTKGKCNKHEKGKCPYKHDESVRLVALERKRQKMIQHQKNSGKQNSQNNPKKSKRQKQSDNTNTTTTMENEDNTQQKELEQRQRHPLGIYLAEGQTEPKILYTGGKKTGGGVKLRHVEPYWIISSLPLEKHVGKTIQDALTIMSATHSRRSKRPPFDFWIQELYKGTLTLHEHNNNHGGYKVVATPNHIIEKSNVLRGTFHFHEESIRYYDNDNDNDNDNNTSSPPLIVYQDDEYLIVNKPAGVDTLTNPNAGRVFNSLPGLLYTEFGIKSCYPAHRIDNNVSGVVCCGKTITAQKRLTHRIKFGEAQKTYLTRVKLSSTSPSSTLPSMTTIALLKEKIPMVIEAPLGFDTETCLAVVVEEEEDSGNDDNNKKKLNDDKTPPLKKQQKSKACKTTIINCQPHTRNDDDNDTAILQIQPNTGRKHQLRKHLQHVGLCIGNDERYGGTVDEKDRVSAFWGTARQTKDENKTDNADASKGTTTTLPLEELLNSSFTDGCSFCSFAKKLFDSGKTTKNNGGDGKILGPSVSTGIWLHSWRYEFPTLDLSFETPIPEWAK